MSTNDPRAVLFPGQTTQSQNPIYDTCDYCRYPVRPGESHGVVSSDDKGEPKLVCKIQRLEWVEQEIPVQHLAPVLSPR